MGGPDDPHVHGAGARRRNGLLRPSSCLGVRSRSATPSRRTTDRHLLQLSGELDSFELVDSGKRTIGEGAYPAVYLRFQWRASYGLVEQMLIMAETFGIAGRETRCFSTTCLVKDAEIDRARFESILRTVRLTTPKGPPPGPILPGGSIPPGRPSLPPPSLPNSVPHAGLPRRPTALIDDHAASRRRAPLRGPEELGLHQHLRRSRCAGGLRHQPGGHPRQPRAGRDAGRLHRSAGGFPGQGGEEVPAPRALRGHGRWRAPPRSSVAPGTARKARSNRRSPS